jgi:hypothetical protein
VGNGEAGAAPAGPAVEQAGQTDQPGYPGEGGGLTDLAVSAFNDLAIGGAVEGEPVGSLAFGDESDSGLEGAGDDFEAGAGPLDGDGENFSAGVEEGAPEAGLVGEAQSSLRELWDAGMADGGSDSAEEPGSGPARTNGIEGGDRPLAAGSAEKATPGAGSENRGQSFLRDLWDTGTAQDGKGPGGGGGHKPGPGGPPKGPGPGGRPPPDSPPDGKKKKGGGGSTPRKRSPVGSPVRKDGGRNRRDTVFERMSKESDERLAKAQDERRAARDTWNRQAIQRNERQHTERWARLKALTK